MRTIKNLICILIISALFTGCIYTKSTTRWTTKDGTSNIITFIPATDKPFAIGLRDDGVMMWRHVERTIAEPAVVEMSIQE